MNLLDKITMAVIRAAFRRLRRRFNEAEGRVFAVQLTTYHAPSRWTGVLVMGFGADDSRLARPLFVLNLTAPMYDALVDGAVHARTEREEQLRELGIDG